MFEMRGPFFLKKMGDLFTQQIRLSEKPQRETPQKETQKEVQTTHPMRRTKEREEEEKKEEKKKKKKKKRGGKGW